MCVLHKYTYSSDCCDIKTIPVVYLKANSMGYDRESENEAKHQVNILPLSLSRCTGRSLSAAYTLPMCLTEYCLSGIFPHWLLLLLGHWGGSERSASSSDRARSGKDKQIWKVSKYTDETRDWYLHRQAMNTEEPKAGFLLSVMQTKTPVNLLNKAVVLKSTMTFWTTYSTPSRHSMLQHTITAHMPQQHTDVKFTKL